MKLNSQIQWGSQENFAFLNSRFFDSVLPALSDQQKVLLNFLVPANEKFHSHVFVLTSGTTARDISDFKWVALSQSALLASARIVNDSLESNSCDIWLHVLPEFHVGGIGIWARSFLSQAQVIQLHRWNACEFTQVVHSNRVTLSSLVPTQVYDLVAASLKCPPSLRSVLVGGAALSASLYQRAFELGWPLLPCYGMTETSSQIACAKRRGRGEDGSLPSLHVLPHCEVNIEESGLIRVRSPSLLSAYVYGQKGRGIIHDPKKEGWFLTTDFGKLDQDILILLGRTKDWIKVGGEIVSMYRLNTLLEYLFIELMGDKSQLSQIALISEPHERLGSVVCLILDQSMPLEGAEKLISSFNQRVLPFERIQQWKFVEKIPRNALGKLMHF